MIKISKYLKQKGQGIVEYALLLAFVVGIAVALQGVGLKDAVVGVFDDVATVLAGGPDLSTPEGRHDADVAKMKTIAEALKASFKKNNDAEDTRINMQKNYVAVAVFPDGTTDIYVDGKGWVSRISDLSNYGDAFAQRYDLSKVSLNYTDTNSEWKDGYFIMYQYDGSVLYKKLNSGDYNTYTTGGAQAGWNWWSKSNISDAALQ